MLIHISYVGCAIHGVVVVHVCDLGDIHSRVRDVHIVHVNTADAIRRNVNLARAKGEPANTLSHTNGEMETAASNKRYQRGSIDGTNVDRSRHPAPAALHEGPAPVVEGRETPRLIFNPCPAPRSNPHPVSEAIRSPAMSDGNGSPYRAVVSIVAPASVVIEIFVAGHFGGDVVGGISVILAGVAIEGPCVEVVGARQLANLMVEFVGTVEDGLLACDYGV